MSDLAQIGAALADLVAHVYALGTENEKGPMLRQRLNDLESSANSIVRRARKIAETRSL